MLQTICELLAFGFLNIFEAAAKGEEALMAFWREFVAKALNLVPSDEPLGTPLFNAHLRLGTGDAFECGCVRRNEKTGEVEVYLVRRATDDSAYPGEWHLPGTFQRRKETPEIIARRLAHKELDSRPFAGLGYFVKKVYPSPERVDTERGHTNSELWLFPGEQDLLVAEDRGWFVFEGLPKPTVYYHQKLFVPAVIDAFKRWEMGGPSAVHVVEPISPK